MSGYLAASAANWERLKEHTASGIAEEPVAWLGAPEVARLVRRAKVTWQRTQRQQQAQAVAPHGPCEQLRFGKRQEEPTQRVTWRAIRGVTLQQTREPGLGAYAEAEYLHSLQGGEMA